VRRRAKGSGALPAALLAAAILSLPFLPSPSHAAEAKLRPVVRPGEKAASFTLSDLDGKRHAYRPADGPALLVFWSAFCPLCREVARPIDEASRRTGGEVRVVWVNLDGKRFSNAVRSFSKEVSISSPVLLDEIRDDLFVGCDPYGIDKTPTAVLVGADGKVRGVYVADQIRTLLRNFDAETAGLRNGKARKGGKGR
jgi:thiol-disulfide isomerase/thioredoxin